MRLFVRHSPWIPVFVLGALLGCSRSSEDQVAHQAAAGRSPIVGDASKARLPLQTVRIPFIENKGQISDQNYKSRPDVLFSGEAGDLVFHLRDKR